MLELTISEEEGPKIILGLNGMVIEYKKINENLTFLNHFNSEIICVYSREWGKDLSLEPKENYYPLILKQYNFEQYCPGKITKIERVFDKPNA